MQGMTQATRQKPFYETALGGVVIALVIVVGLLFVAYVFYVNSGDESTTVDCTYDANSASCTRY